MRDGLWQELRVHEDPRKRDMQSKNGQKYLLFLLMHLKECRSCNCTHMCICQLQLKNINQDRKEFLHSNPAELIKYFRAIISW